jgi:SAM-dependent methyltransferase
MGSKIAKHHTNRNFLNMPTGSEPNLEILSNHCAVCGATDLESVVDLPGLPLTGRFADKRPESIPAGIDQELFWCFACGHAQLDTRNTSEVSYDNAYAFRTSNSVKGRDGTSFFLEVLREFSPTDQFSCAVDVGCNDFLFLQELGDRAVRRIGIDPIWAGREDEVGADIEVIGNTIEEADLPSRLDNPPDLIALRHTIEHIHDPMAMLRSLVEVAADDAIFLIETPGFDTLVRRNRFDQLFHDHAHYFTHGSLRHLAESVGLNYLGHRDSYHESGAIAAVFQKTFSAAKQSSPSPQIWNAHQIRQQYQLFKQHMEATAAMLDSFKGELVYGYGAANLVPTLAYHLNNDLSVLEAVLDDDPSKDGKAYWNLPVSIRLASKVNDLSKATVLLTAVDNVAPIMTKLLRARPNHIIYPLSVI